MFIRIIKAYVLIVMVALLSGCQKAPPNSSVISKNDGSFDVAVIQSAPKSEESTSSTICQRQERFMSTDGTIEFTLNVNEEIIGVPMPVVEVTPHNLTEEDSKRIAYILFGDAEFYEAEPLFASKFSQSDIQEKLARWIPYGGDNGAIDGYIQEYTLLLETAPIDNPHTPCLWTFKKSTYYFESKSDADAMDTSGDNDEIQASVKMDGIPYIFNVAKRDKSDFKLNSIYVKPYDGLSPTSIDTKIFRTQLCQTRKPKEEDLAVVKAQAEELLKKMELGNWIIDECYVDVSNKNDIPEYTIVVKAVPVFEQVAAIRRPQLNNLKSKEIYASNYYLTDTQFEFNVNGDLVSFNMTSPVDVKAVINANVKVLSMEDLTGIAINHLSLSDYYQYDYLGYITDSAEELECKVNISNVDYGLTRVKVPNTDDSYYYVPAMIFWGSIQYHGEETGNIYDVELDYGTEFPLLILNAIDGTVINAINE